MRHGEAGFSASSDFSRALTNYGIKQSNQAGMWLKEQGYQFELGLVSPYLRAQQTFTALSSHVNVAKIETDQFLVPGGNSSHAAGILTMLLAEGTENVIVVSHLPLVGYLVNELCPQINPPMFPTAAIACINLSLDSAGKLEWFYQAE